MSLPAFDPSGILPPFVGPPAGARRSPYEATMSEVIELFATSHARCRILRGLLSYRGRLRQVGVREAFQWLDGSFVERRGVEPKDVDVVTFAHVHPAPSSLPPADIELFSPPRTKAQFSCDAYFVALESPTLVQQTCYWFGLFSHRRESLQWKGLVHVTLDDPDEDAVASGILDGMEPTFAESGL